MIANIVDGRRNRHRWKKLHVVAEATWHDNSVDGADQAEVDRLATDYDERHDISLGEAIAWGQAQPGEITLFIYDFDATTAATSAR